MEVCVLGTWGRTCNNLWGDENTRVVCRQLGLSDKGIFFYFTIIDYSITNTILIVFRYSSYEPEKASMHLKDVNCTGDEASLFQCPNHGVGIHDCDEAAVLCYNGKLIK